MAVSNRLIDNKYRFKDYKNDVVFDLAESTKDWMVIQYTGLSASKSYRGCSSEDLLIYEGDLLKYKEVIYEDCSREKILEVRPEAIIEIMSYHEMATVVKVHSGNVLAFCHDWENSTALILELKGDSLEIIGNIYENPELLEIIREE